MTKNRCRLRECPHARHASTEPLTQACVDPRWKHVSKGCAPAFERLPGKWAVPGYSRNKYPDLAAARAAKDTYGDHIVQLLNRIVKTDVATLQPDEIAPDGYLWIVQAGAYKSLNNAKAPQDRMENMGVVTLINMYSVNETER